MQGYSRESRTLENSPQAPVAVSHAKVVGRPPSPEIPNWHSVKQCVESVLDDRSMIFQLPLETGGSNQFGHRYTRLSRNFLPF